MLLNPIKLGIMKRLQDIIIGILITMKEDLKKQYK
jgi:hypothetical protein